MNVSLQRAKSEILGRQAGVKFRRFILAFRYAQDQPRDERGRWTESDDSNAVENDLPLHSNLDDITDRARQLNLAAQSNGYQKCLDICYPLLERFQPPGSDRNTWDFHKCMNICLGR